MIGTSKREGFSRDCIWSSMRSVTVSVLSLKQLTDQVAQGTEIPCLYISFRTPKATLRLRTLSRLAGLPARDIEGGSFEKTAPEWKKVEEIGRKAAVWLNRVFIVEAGADVDVHLLKEMAKRLLCSSAKRTGLIVIDDLGGLGKVNTSLLSGLRNVSESLALPLVVATAQAALVNEDAVEGGASFRKGEGTEMKLEIQRSGGTPVIVSLDDDPDTYRFEERSDS